MEVRRHRGAADFERQQSHFVLNPLLNGSVRPILRIGEYSLVVLQHRRIRYIGLRVSADAE